MIQTNIEDSYKLLSTDEIYYYLSIKDLEEIGLSGVVNVEGTDFKTTSLDIDMKGTANVELTGKVDSLTIFIDGTANFSGKDLISEECYIDVPSGNANIVVNVINRLNISFKGIGSVKYIGDPEIIQEVSDIVEIEKIE